MSLLTPITSKKKLHVQNIRYTPLPASSNDFDSSWSGVGRGEWRVLGRGWDRYRLEGEWNTRWFNQTGPDTESLDSRLIFKVVAYITLSRSLQQVKKSCFWIFFISPGRKAAVVCVYGLCVCFSILYMLFLVSGPDCPTYITTLCKSDLKNCWNLSFVDWNLKCDGTIPIVFYELTK